MPILLLGLLGLACWAWKTGRLSLMKADAVAAVAALVGLRMLETGRPLAAAVALAGAGWWLWSRTRAPAGERPDADEARRLLEVPPGADERLIRSAHRRLVARVHPDAGGSAELARRVNAARDTLLGELRASGRG